MVVSNTIIPWGWLKWLESWTWTVGCKQFKRATGLGDLFIEITLGAFMENSLPRACAPGISQDFVLDMRCQ